MKDADRYPLALAALERLTAHERADGNADAPLKAFSIGPSVLRPSPALSAPPSAPAPLSEDAEAPGDALDPGELVEMLLVGSEEAGSGHPEVHLVFKSDVLGGLHLILVKEPAGMRARFIVQDAIARRTVAAHLDDLVAHLRGRGFSIVSHEVELARS
jgi:hypothetical protein